MSETVKALFEGLGNAVQAIAPGLKNIGPEITEELARLGTQGGMETASLLFAGSAFVPYGPGQYTLTPSPTPGPEHAPSAHEHEMER